MDIATRDVKDEEGTKGLEAVFTVDVPPDALLEILWSPDNFPRLYPEIREARVVRGEGSWLEVAYRVHAVIRDVRYVLRRTIDREARTITWREIGGDLRRVRGGWRIEAGPEPGTSRATYRAFVEVGRFVPTGLVRNVAKTKLGEMVARVRRVSGSISR